MMKKELTREELIKDLTSKGMAESFLETFETEDLQNAYDDPQGPYIYLMALNNNI